MGTLPSSRLTKILQEKAEILKKRRATAEVALKEVEEAVRLLGLLDLPVPDWKEKEAAFRDLARRSEWESLETQAKAFQDSLSASGSGVFFRRRAEIAERGDRLTQFGATLPSELLPLLKDAQQPTVDGPWISALEPLSRLQEGIRLAESEFSGRLRGEAMAIAEWSGETGERPAQLDARFRAVLDTIHTGGFADAVARLNDVVSNELPLAKARRDSARAAGAALVAAARDLSVPSADLEAALQGDAEAVPTTWNRTVPAVEAENAKIADLLRDRVQAAIESLRATLHSLREQGVDPTSSLIGIEELLAPVRTAGPAELPGLLTKARQLTEEPVVAVVASLLDEVRPRLVEARRLGRDPSEVFAAMNRAREALRLKIYSEALAASQEAVERVSQLTEDLDSAREEAESLEALLTRLASAKFPTAPFDEQLKHVTSFLDRIELEAARKQLQETVHSLGREAFTHFSLQQIALDRVATLAQERGFLPDGVTDEILHARNFLEEGQLADAGELLASLEVRLRTAAGPYVARRVEEIEKGFAEIPDEALVRPVRRLLADADVNLRVKEDLTGSMEALKRAEREFSAVFAARASSLVEQLEEERRALEAMGGTGDEIQRQIDEVQQIFNMGDFVKASRASQEIRTRAHQQQLLRSEDAVSHAKLALVELGKMGLDTGSLRGSLEAAHEAARLQKYPDAYRLATETQSGAHKLRSSAQGVLDALSDATELWQATKELGLPVDPLREKIGEAKQLYQALEFEQAASALAQLTAALTEARDRAIAGRLLSDSQLLLEDARRMSVPTDELTRRAAEVTVELAEPSTAPAIHHAKALLAEIVLRLRPVLEENLRLLTADLELARSAGVEAPEVLDSLGDARRNLSAEVPTGAAERIEHARSQLIETRGFLEHAQKATKRAREALNEAELVRVDAHAARATMEKVEVLLGERSYAKVIELAASVERELTQATYQQVSKTLAGFQAQVVHARQGGSDATLADNLLTQARTALNDGHPFDALQLAARSEGEIERVELQLRIAQSSLETVEGKLGNAVQHGVKLPAAEAELHKARSAFHRHEYPQVLELAIVAADLIAVGREQHRRAREALDAADRQVKEAMELGADLGEVVSSLDLARRHADAGEYLETIPKAREVAERALWAIDKQYSGALAEVRHLLETAEGAQSGTELAAVRRPFEEAEAALRAREWKRAGDGLAAAREAALRSLDTLLSERLEALPKLYHDDGEAPPQEVEFRRQASERISSEMSRRNYPGALAALGEESHRLTERWRQGLGHRVNELKDRVWVGEKLGLDTTPVMELFSEAKLALEGGKLSEVPPLLGRADLQLTSLVKQRVGERLREVQTELTFAQEGLHVSVGSVPQTLALVEERRAAGREIEAAQALLAADEELNRRKSMHRELMNIHYLIDAALVRAHERHLDVTPARSALDESIRLRVTDYAQALEKAREALTMLQGQLKGGEAPAGMWPFRRPDSNP
ncbi:MAG: hypothetical protein L3K19_04325 [Thermoplasmata archaeon]|nr:hypothetical protein [Thermoplasmata archaeon]